MENLNFCCGSRHCGYDLDLWLAIVYASTGVIRTHQRFNPFLAHHQDATSTLVPK